MHSHQRLPFGFIDQLPAMIAYWDSDLKCRFSNEKYFEWFGLSPSQMTGIAIQQLMGEELFARNATFIYGALSGKPQTFERALRKPSGQIGHTWANYTPDVGRRGQVLGFYAMVTDVTRMRFCRRPTEPSEVDAPLDTREASGLQRLSARELEVVHLVIDGNTSKQIARRLGISFRTVQAQRAAAMRKTGVRTTAGLVNFAMQHGLAQLPTPTP